mgnify:CR=1 FL=1
MDANSSQEIKKFPSISLAIPGILYPRITNQNNMTRNIKLCVRRIITHYLLTNRKKLQLQFNLRKKLNNPRELPVDQLYSLKRYSSASDER